MVICANQNKLRMFIGFWFMAGQDLSPYHLLSGRLLSIVCTARYPLKGLPSERLFPLRVKVRQLRQLLMQQPDMEHLEHQASLPRPTYLCGRLRAFSLAHTWENALDGVLEQELVMSLGASAVVLLVVVCSRWQTP